MTGSLMDPLGGSMALQEQGPLPQAVVSLQQQVQHWRVFASGPESLHYSRCHGTVTGFPGSGSCAQ